jgi:hypothetical protein
MSFEPEVFNKVQNLAVKLGRRVNATHDPAIEILVGLIDQGFESIHLSGRKAVQKLVGKGAEDQVRFPKASMPSAELHTPQPNLVH